MLKHDRQQQILNYLKMQESVSLQELMDHTDVAKLTIQRDLVELEQDKKLIRVHGGAINTINSFIGIPRSVREKENIEIKRGLAKFAAQEIQSDDTIAIDPSTTCSYLPEFIPDIPTNIVTPSIDTFSALCQKPNISPILSGGQLNKKTQNLIGSIAAETIKKFSYSLCFISCDGLDPERGSLELDLEDSMIKKDMIEVSKKIILIVDSSKINNHKGILTCPIEKISKIITDQDINKSWPEEVRNKIVII